MLAGWTASPERRGSWDIIWSCLFTVFICCWTAIHPNIPPPNSQQSYRFLDRTIYLLLAALGLELILAVAVRDYLDAKAYAKCCDRTSVTGRKVGQSCTNFTFAWANNAEVRDGWLSAVVVECHVKRAMLKLEEVTSQEEIVDKGNADWLVKCMLGFQVLGSARNVSRGQFNISPSPRSRSALSRASHLCSLLCGFGGISHTTSMSLPSSMDNLFLTAYLTKQDIPKFQPLPYRPFALVRECLRVIESGCTHAPDPVRGGGGGGQSYTLLCRGITLHGLEFPFPHTGRGESAR